MAALVSWSVVSMAAHLMVPRSRLIDLRAEELLSL